MVLIFDEEKEREKEREKGREKERENEREQEKERESLLPSPLQVIESMGVFKKAKDHQIGRVMLTAPQVFWWSERNIKRERESD